MTNKQAIERVAEFKRLDLYQETYDSLDVVLSLAERMAMYDWWWGIEPSKAGELDLFDIYRRDNHPMCENEEARVIAAWKKYTAKENEC